MKSILDLQIDKSLSKICSKVFTSSPLVSQLSTPREYDNHVEEREVGVVNFEGVATGATERREDEMEVEARGPPSHHGDSNNDEDEGQGSDSAVDADVRSLALQNNTHGEREGGDVNYAGVDAEIERNVDQPTQPSNEGDDEDSNGGGGGAIGRILSQAPPHPHPSSPPPPKAGRRSSPSSYTR